MLRARRTQRTKTKTVKVLQTMEKMSRIQQICQLMSKGKEMMKRQSKLEISNSQMRISLMSRQNLLKTAHKMIKQERQSKATSKTLKARMKTKPMKTCQIRGEISMNLKKRNQRIPKC